MSQQNFWWTVTVLDDKVPDIRFRLSKEGGYDVEVIGGEPFHEFDDMMSTSLAMYLQGIGWTWSGCHGLEKAWTDMYGYFEEGNVFVNGTGSCNFSINPKTGVFEKGSVEQKEYEPFVYTVWSEVQSHLRLFNTIDDAIDYSHKLFALVGRGNDGTYHIPILVTPINQSTNITYKLPMYRDIKEVYETVKWTATDVTTQRVVKLENADKVEKFLMKLQV